MSITYLALGSNIGDRRTNLRRAVEALSAGVAVLAQSPIYETPAWGYADQAAFLNMVLKGETGLAPEPLLAFVKQVETDLGRTPTFHWGPRLIDIDILLYDQLVLHTPGLTIPHARLHERAFVLVPLADLAADAVHPVLGQTISELLGKVDKAGITRWNEQA